MTSLNVDFNFITKNLNLLTSNKYFVEADGFLLGSISQLAVVHVFHGQGFLNVELCGGFIYYLDELWKHTDGGVVEHQVAGIESLSDNIRAKHAKDLQRIAFSQDYIARRNSHCNNYTKLSSVTW